MTEATPEPSSLAEIALLRVRRSDSAPFLMTIDERQPHEVRARSYGEAAERAAALAGALAAAGVAPGERVGCYLSNAPCWVVGALGTWWAGGVVAAVGTLVPGPEAARLFELAGVSTVVAAAGAPALPATFRVVTIDEEGDGVGATARPATGAGPLDFRLPDPDELGAIFFTSGTTGQPKGITYTHGDFVTGAKRVAGGYARKAAYRPDPAPAHLAPGVVFNPFGHTAGFLRLAFRMWIGRPALLIPRFTVPAVQAYFSRFSADSLQLTPTMIHMLATSGEPIELRGVQYVTSGTAPLSVATRDRFEQRFGVPVLDAYGMTEVGVVSQERLEDVRAGRRRPGSVGRPATGVDIRIRPLDDEDRPEGEGEILVRTKDMPAEFVGGAKVPVDAEGWFATGDVGRLEDGLLYVTGRAQEKIIVGGFNVYPAEVEDAARRSPLVTDLVVVGLPDDRLGERPVAGIVWAGAPDEEALLRELRTGLAHYKVPRGTFALDAVPLTPRDKVDRRRARELARAAFDQVAADGGAAR
ncbi:long-chain fatty acid--CoA ligase [Frankia sp. AgB1.9]|uniref:class I adenylate-forming enzyme family protein n=1 Tax=unclassified Frankia TaxID=2632575 RepID=UPI001933A5D6|nr:MULTISPECIES: fatty acid--CoA ligase family protein [unclassified Frankia]MBL7494121.1 long-chain fatty acid--CoA ligase [Frankia sp. AgW1.1]MBL7551098.1 long-chain fatty acid--CoA ligase [Frankia sp. AgB1.9]MBL7624736.1 long-chain fatty acid--CoA ligase [Frankia sp. AgB1.8]